MIAIKKTAKYLESFTHSLNTLHALTEQCVAIQTDAFYPIDITNNNKKIPLKFFCTREKVSTPMIRRILGESQAKSFYLSRINLSCLQKARTTFERANTLAQSTVINKIKQLPTTELHKASHHYQHTYYQLQTAYEIYKQLMLPHIAEKESLYKILFLMYQAYLLAKTTTASKWDEANPTGLLNRALRFYTKTAGERSEQANLVRETKRIMDNF